MDQQEAEEIEVELKKLQEETTKQVNDAVSRLAKDFVDALKSLQSKQDSMMEIINNHKRTNFKIIEEQATKEMAQNKEEEYMIKLNVGGQMFTTSKMTLLSRPDTYFSAMLGSGRWKPQTDGSYFIDRNPKYFEIILEYLRTNMLGTHGLNEQQQQFLQCEMDYFQIPLPPKRVDSLILANHEDKEELLCSWLPDKQKIGPLLFRASEEPEFSARKFHEVCDGQAPLLIIAQTTAGDICGGYAASPFFSPALVEKSAVANEKSWIFTLVNQFNIPAQLFPQKPEVAQVDSTTWGPAFGGVLLSGILTASVRDNDLVFISKQHPSSGFTHFPQAYKDTTGKGKALFSRTDVHIAGSYFPLAILEVFKIVT